MPAVLLAEAECRELGPGRKVFLEMALAIVLRLPLYDSKYVRTVIFRMVIQMANSKSQMVNGKGYDIIVWRQSVIVPAGAVVVQD